MKFRILRYSAMTRREIYKSIAKWVLFSLVLLVSYTIEVTMPFASWQPYLTLTTAVAVSFFQRRTERCCLCGFCRDDARSCDGLVVRVYVDMADAVLPFCYSACCKPYSQKYSELSLDESDRSYSGAVCGAFIQIYNMEKPQH